MKKTYSIIMIITLSITMLLPTNLVIASTNTQNKGVKIDKNNFPCDLLREAIEEYFDIEGDGYLSKYEISKVKEFGVNADIEQQEEDYLIKHKKFTKEEAYKRYAIIDCKGLEIFKNLTDICISAGGINGSGAQLKNMKVLSKLPKLKILTIKGITRVKKYNFKGFKTLKTLYINECKNVNSFKFDKNSKIEKINLDSTSSNGNLNLSSLKKLKTFNSEFTKLKKITFGKKNKKLESIVIYGSRDKESRNKKIKTLDVSKVKNLKKLDIISLYNLKTVKLGKKPKLRIMEISQCKKLKKISLKGCTNLKKSRTWINGKNLKRYGYKG